MGLVEGDQPIALLCYTWVAGGGRPATHYGAADINIVGRRIRIVNRTNVYFVPQSTRFTRWCKEKFRIFEDFDRFSNFEPLQMSLEHLQKVR
jgi:hypothetical protein